MQKLGNYRASPRGCDVACKATWLCHADTHVCLRGVEVTRERVLYLPFHVPFFSLYSSLISALTELLKSNFDRKRKKNSHLELHYSSLESRNENPYIRRLIGSFRRLIWVRLRVFILIFHHLVLILYFES